eukprot:scaffold268_cov134-Isochrysis_galbana.AAC.4
MEPQKGAEQEQEHHVHEQHGHDQDHVCDGRKPRAILTPRPFEYARQLRGDGDEREPDEAYCVQYKEQEELAVVEPYSVENPRAEMIHVEGQALRHGAVMRTLRLVKAGFPAYSGGAEAGVVGIIIGLGLRRHPTLPRLRRHARVGGASVQPAHHNESE